VVLQTFGPLPSYGSNKFIVVIREEATGYIEFSAAEDRQPKTFAENLIKSWIAKLYLPPTLVTGLSPEDNQLLSNNVNDQLGLESNHLIMETSEINKMPNHITPTAFPRQ
jgi:hypothetical protein